MPMLRPMCETTIAPNTTANRPAFAFEAAVFAVLATLGVCSRLLIEIPNFSAVAACALFGGFYFRRRWMVVALPIVTMLLSDLALGFYSPMLMASVYLSLAMAAALGRVVRSNPRLGFGAGAMLAGSVLFFLCTNFAVWAGSQWYTQDLKGLAHCFTLALPFFRYTLLSDVLFASAIFGAWALARRFGARAAVATA